MRTVAFPKLMSDMRRVLAALGVFGVAFVATGALSATLSATLNAQSSNYPAMQTPRLVEREYNFMAASASRAGTSVVFQWREALQGQWQFGFDGGLTSPPGDGGTRMLVGFAFAYQAARASDDFPFDVAYTVGAGGSLGGGYSVFRLPVGVVVGHTFELDGPMRLTPFAHPRLSIDRCSSCGRAGGDSKLNVDVDVGVDFTIAPQVSLRLGALLGGSDYIGGSSSVGFSVAWTPKGLRKPEGRRGVR